MQSSVNRDGAGSFDPEEAETENPPSRSGQLRAAAKAYEDAAREEVDILKSEIGELRRIVEDRLHSKKGRASIVLPAIAAFAMAAIAPPMLQIASLGGLVWFVRRQWTGR